MKLCMKTELQILMACYFTENINQDYKEESRGMKLKNGFGERYTVGKS